MDKHHSKQVEDDEVDIRRQPVLNPVGKLNLNKTNNSSYICRITSTSLVHVIKQQLQTYKQPLITDRLTSKRNYTNFYKFYRTRTHYWIRCHY